MILPVTDYNIKNNQYFTAKAKKFRLPVQSYIYTIDGIPLWSKRCNAIKEFLAIVPLLVIVANIAYSYICCRAVRYSL